MKIIENINCFTKEVTYSIYIKQDDNIDPTELAECFKEQYPNEICIISFSRVVKVECGIILVGLNLGKRK